MESVSLYSEARNEYIKQLSTWIVPPLVEFFRKEYGSIAEREGRRVMPIFQTWCSEIPKWNQDVIDTHVGALLDSCRCDYVEELMTAVFIAHTKMLTSIRISTRQKKLQITLPKLDHFLHRVFVECARSFWKAPFLFSDEFSPIERQKNILQLESMCTEALSSAVRSLLPVKSILRDYLEDDEEFPTMKSKSKREKEESDSEEEKPVKKRSKHDSDSEEEAPTKTHSTHEDDSDEEIRTIKHSKRKTSSDIQDTDVPAEDVKMIGGDKHSIPYVENKAPIEIPQPIVLEKEPCMTVEEVVDIPTADHVESDSIIKSLPDTNTIETAEELTGAAKLHSILESIEANPPEPLSGGSMDAIEIDTAPSVRFSDYETVFDEKSNTNEIRYAPKLSVEEIPDEWGPKLEISDTTEGLGDLEIEDLEPTSKPQPMKPVSQQEEEDVDIPLNMDEFEQL
jgi:hypothetical protein